MIREIISEKKPIAIAQEAPEQPSGNSLTNKHHHIVVEVSEASDGDEQQQQPLKISNQSLDSSFQDAERTAINVSRGIVEDTELSEESSKLLTVQPGYDQASLRLDRTRSKWVKLRSTIKVARAFAPSSRKKQQLERQDSFLKRFSTRQAGCQYGEDPIDGKEPEERQSKETDAKPPMNCVINPDETFMFVWLSGLTCAVLYNLWTCIAREAFPEIHDGFEPLWFTADALCDLVYLLDVVVQMRTGYLERGLIVYDSMKLTKHYVYSRDFVLDTVSLLPLDLLQIYIGIHPLVRFPRFIKAYRLYRFIYMVETRTAFPNMWRVANLSHVLFLGCHWFAAFYFLISKAEQFSTSWSYPKPVGEYASVTQKYLRSLYWSTLTLTTIGDLQSPESNWEFVFTITSYLIGVFVFATVVGQVGNVITNQNASRQEFERHLDGAKAYMRYHNVPRNMQQRVQRWYDYAWSRGRMNGGGDINSLGLLPDKLKTELALHVNLETLKKVAIFHKCEPEFLHDLVLKMKAYIFTPRDLICRKGEVAREMFIIADGIVEVVSDTGDVLKQMGAGDFFGEIGILNLDGGVNRRTADVRSLGYSELFVLSRDDVLSAFKDHPEAEVLIKEYGEKRLRELGEHKRRRLCERLAKELTTSNAEGGGSTVSKMVLSTGLLHGIGVGASSKSSTVTNNEDADRSVVPNGRGLRGPDRNDRWDSIISSLRNRGKKDSAGTVVVQTSRSTDDGVGRGGGGGGEEISPSQDNESFTIQNSNEITSIGNCKMDNVTSTTKPSSSTSGTEEVPKVIDAIISHRLAGIFSKKKSSQSRPGKLWSLGGVGIGQAVTRLVSPETSHQKPKTMFRTEICESNSSSSVPGKSSSGSGRKSQETEDDIKRESKSTTIAVPRLSHRTSILDVIRMQRPTKCPDGLTSVQSNDDVKFCGKSNNSDDTKCKSPKGQKRENDDETNNGLGSSSLLAVSSTVQSDASRVVDITETLIDKDTCHVSLRAKTVWQDPQNICAEVADIVRAFIHNELVAMHSQYQSRLQQLEQEVAQKQQIIDRLRLDLNATEQETRGATFTPHTDVDNMAPKKQ